MCHMACVLSESQTEAYECLPQTCTQPRAEPHEASDVKQVFLNPLRWGLTAPTYAPAVLIFDESASCFRRLLELIRLENVRHRPCVPQIEGRTPISADDLIKLTRYYTYKNEYVLYLTL